jgi:hypothetical protein
MWRETLGETTPSRKEEREQCPEPSEPSEPEKLDTTNERRSRGMW